MGAPIVMWHGGRWKGGPPTLAPAPAKRMAHGPGLYLTTSVETARRYAKGGGVITRVELDPSVRWLSRGTIPVEAAVRWARETPRLKAREKIVADLRHSSERMRGDDIPGDTLLNLLLAHEALSGQIGLALAAFLIAQGFDGDRIPHDNEDWAVIWNPDVILHHRVVPAGEATDAPRLAAWRW